MPRTRRSKQEAPVPAMPPKEYNETLKGLSLESVRLSNAQLVARSLPDSTKLTVGIDYSAERCAAPGDRVCVVAHCRFKAFEETPDKEALSICADYEVVLKSAKAFSDEFFSIYVDLSLPVNVWPYFREFVQNMLGRAGYPPFALPLLMRPASTLPAPRRKRAIVR